MKRRRNLFQELMDEHIRLPGVPQLVVTRGYAYQWLLMCGYDPAVKGFGSIDYAVFSPKPLEGPLMDLEPYREFLDGVLADLRTIRIAQ